jgi:dipeptidyl aminopeptidase/acylaminoacyl peptidase
MINARNALEFTLAKMPEVNPKKIFAAGHSSAGTAALLFAAHEPRLAGCIAYAPCIDLEKNFPGWQVRLLSSQMDGLADFVTQSSPSTHVSRIRCPTLLFHAEDDAGCDIADTRSFAEKLQAQGTETKLVTVASGGHYDSMIEQGIPAGIEFIREKTGLR